MSGYLTTAITTIKVNSYLENYIDSYNKNMVQLSSGNKVNSIGDDPMATANSDACNLTITGNKQAISNMQIGENLLNTVQGTEQNVITSLQRIRDLCTEAANGTYSTKDKQAIIDEINQRLNEFDRLADNTNFNNINLFDGSQTSLKIQTGTKTGASIDIGDALVDLHSNSLGSVIPGDGGITLTGVTGNNWTTDQINAYGSKIEGVISDITTDASKSGSYINRLDTQIASVQNLNLNLTSENSAIMDTDVASASADLVKYQIAQQVSASILTQANQIPEYALSLLTSVK